MSRKPSERVADYCSMFVRTVFAEGYGLREIRRDDARGWHTIYSSGELSFTVQDDRVERETEDPMQLAITDARTFLQALSAQ